MTRTTVTLLFTKDKSEEPPGILQCDTSGEYYPHYFYDWRDAVHYIQWCLNHGKYGHEAFSQWSEQYGYDEDETFNGDLNEFRNSDDPWMVFTSVGVITGDMDLNDVSVWTIDIDHIYYTGIGSEGKEIFTINEFINIMKEHSHEFMPPPSNSDNFSLDDWIEYSGAEIVYKTTTNEDLE